ncbi:MAG: hypothetical protein H6835_15580 [Planctomycetes bacterium]|nr:hypothetical protein [Planctomycetota bacterium]
MQEIIDAAIDAVRDQTLNVALGLIGQAGEKCLILTVPGRIESPLQNALAHGDRYIPESGRDEFAKCI